MNVKAKKSGLFAYGDINGFLGLVSDNMANLSLATVMLMIFKFPREVIFYNIYPGIVLIIFLGNLIMTIIAIRIAKKTGRTDITAMPYGLDAPTTITLPLIVVGPLFVTLKQNGMDPHSAAILAWQAGMASVAIIGLFKICATPFANAISRIVPMAGLLGSLAGIGVMIGIFALTEIFALPLVGIISLGFVLYILIARIPFPKKLPGLLIGVLGCALIYHILGLSGILTTHYTAPAAKLAFSFPTPTLGLFDGFKLIWPLLPAIIPFAILVTIGDINVTVSAVDVGDPYKPKNILLLDGITTLIGAFCGSITQTTAYAGQPAYKAMGSKMGYTLYIAIFMAVCGFTGIVSYIIELIPTAIFAPILIFVGIEIIAQGFSAVPKRHYVASAFAMFPSAMKPMLISLTGGAYLAFPKLLSMSNTVTETYPNILVLAALVNGFILTGMLWGGLVAELIDRNLKKSAVYLFILAVFSFFGIVQSVDINGIMYLPWTLPDIARTMCYHITIGYLVLGILFLFLSFQKNIKEATHH
ncbi:MAG: hypothetical protein GY756_13355 [bacterium]|nr:hypothetical protein [bacterium]